MSTLRDMKDLFAGPHFDRDVILLCVRWYLCSKLNFRNLVEMMDERGLGLSHTTIMRWVHRYAPEFEKHWARLANLTIPELEQSRTAVLNTLASAQSHRSHQYAIERFFEWYFGILSLAESSAQIGSPDF